MATLRGNGLVRTAFADADMAGLDDAVAVLTVSASPVVVGLVMAVDARHWQQTRSAVSGLRRTRPPAVAAAPALAGWVALCAAESAVPGRTDRPYAVNEALGGLAELRTALDGSWYLDLPAACRRIAGFLDEVFQPWLLGVLARPMRVWHRGALVYLRGRHGDQASVAAAVSHYLACVADDDDPPADHEWFAHTRTEAAALLDHLGRHDQPVQGSAEPRSAADLLPVDSLVHLAEHHPDAEVRAGALDALAAAQVDDDRVLTIALRAADSDHAYERAAAVLLLAGLG